MAKPTRGKKTPAPAPYIDRGEPLPQSYGENRIVALVRDPEHIYVYWDVDSEVRVAGKPLLLRIHCVSEERSYDLGPDAGADNWYFQVTPNRTYRFDLFEKRGGKFRMLASSREATTPVRWAGESGAQPPAEIYHAARHPIAREGKPRGRRARAPAATAPAGLAPAAAGPMPPSPAPVPVPAPVEKVFAAVYSRGARK